MGNLKLSRKSSISFFSTKELTFVCKISYQSPIRRGSGFKAQRKPKRFFVVDRHYDLFVAHSVLFVSKIFTAHESTPSGITLHLHHQVWIFPLRCTDLRPVPYVTLLRWGVVPSTRIFFMAAAAASSGGTSEASGEASWPRWRRTTTEVRGPKGKRKRWKNGLNDVEIRPLEIPVLTSKLKYQLFWESPTLILGKIKGNNMPSTVDRHAPNI